MTTIEWTALRARRTAAARLGISLDGYDRHLHDGEKWCGGCREWHHRGQFPIDRSRGDGLHPHCREARRATYRATYQLSDEPQPRGRRYVEPRDGDYRQARRRVNYLVQLGLLPPANSVPCVDCAHEWVTGERRHEYDHHLGYGADHHEDVEAVCTTCHHTRETRRRAAA